ncbi:Similar to mRNA cap guanine-N7 methyltransferase; acc. no. A1DMG9 [Pyronema omphalodes CBS 100304]|uniref:mRNA cap guanine-N(7) methyltransferase n=1 Tax=Pyronema omphalodes (strain CBS 100304) TaxID=1076935 RepID=U4L5P8_PYROM|nr:Similar to mRNA cap guanine-N7 methyltransferase; acc. no. A1DMG9 [Pyronema omphalodes CBS 100304]
MPNRDRYDPARDCFTSDPAPPQHPPQQKDQSSSSSHDGPASEVRKESPKRKPTTEALDSSPPARAAEGRRESPVESRKRKASPDQSPRASRRPDQDRRRQLSDRPERGDRNDRDRNDRDRNDRGRNDRDRNDRDRNDRGDRNNHNDRDRPDRRDERPTQRRRRDSPRGENRYRYRSPPRNLIPSSTPADPTPPPSRPASPPRQRKRPGAASRLTEQEKSLLRATVAASEEAEKARLLGSIPAPERPDELVRSHYNDKKELGKQWRQNSKIKGLRSFNNWVKSTLIQKFSPRDDFDPRAPPSQDPNDFLVVLDMGCGKGGDLLKWKSAPQEVGFYLGLDTADVSIAHARDRYGAMRRERPRGRDRRNVFQAEFHAMDCWVQIIDRIPIVERIGFEHAVGPGTNSRFARGGGFDVVSMMFCMHYAFETEQKCRTMLRNVAGALKAGGRFIGTIPSSDIISSRVRGEDKRDSLPENEENGVQEWGNSIYREAVEEVPEYVVPWEAFRGIAEDYGLELEYKKLFSDVWREEKDNGEMRLLAERMGVRKRDGSFALSDEEWEACSFYLAFSFRKS